MSDFKYICMSFEGILFKFVQKYNIQHIAAKALWAASLKNTYNCFSNWKFWKTFYANMEKLKLYLLYSKFLAVLFIFVFYSICNEFVDQICWLWLVFFTAIKRLSNSQFNSVKLSHHKFMHFSNNQTEKIIYKSINMEVHI